MPKATSLFATLVPHSTSCELYATYLTHKSWGLKTKQYVQCLETAPTSQAALLRAPHCGLHTAGAQKMLLARSPHLTVCSPISLLSLCLPHLRLPTHPSLSTYVGPGAQPGVEKGPSPAQPASHSRHSWESQTSCQTDCSVKKSAGSMCQAAMGTEGRAYEHTDESSS